MAKIIAKPVLMQIIVVHVIANILLVEEFAISVTRTLWCNVRHALLLIHVALATAATRSPTTTATSATRTVWYNARPALRTTTVEPATPATPSPTTTAINATRTPWYSA